METIFIEDKNNRRFKKKKKQNLLSVSLYSPDSKNEFCNLNDNKAVSKSSCRGLHIC